MEPSAVGNAGVLEAQLRQWPIMMNGNFFRIATFKEKSNLSLAPLNNKKADLPTLAGGSPCSVYRPTYTYLRPCCVFHFIRGKAWLARARTVCTASTLQFQLPFVSA